ncbi:hypothetical protein PspLS_11737 [Pyricularia sp. CBS 133598]|nr:hypothetical protein PspLS_11737 [Pyricularia sp. CBS 133598]
MIESLHVSQRWLHIYRCFEKRLKPTANSLNFVSYATTGSQISRNGNTVAKSTLTTGTHHFDMIPLFSVTPMRVLDIVLFI